MAQEVKVVFKPVEKIKDLYIEAQFKVLAERRDDKGVRVIEQIEFVSAALYGAKVDSDTGAIVLASVETVPIEVGQIDRPIPTLADFMAKHTDAEVVEE